MRFRTQVHRRSPMAQYFEEGDQGLWLLPGAVLEADAVNTRLQTLIPEASSRTGYLGALLAFALWDHPEIEWELQEDPDAVLRLEGEDLVRVATAAAAELYSIRTTRLGMDSGIVMLLAIRASRTWLPSIAAGLERHRQGEAEPRRTGTPENGNDSTS